MDLSGYVDSIVEATTNIDSGRKGFAIKGKADEGRVLYEEGIALALSVFQQASNSGFAAIADPQAIMLAEYTFLTQELQLCPKTDKNAVNSLTKAVQSFDDAFLVLKIVEDKTFYHITDKSIPRDKKYRVKGYPKDSFHIACGSHIIRIKNILSSPGIDPIEKDLLQQRQANLSTAQNAYVEKQKKALNK